MFVSDASLFLRKIIDENADAPFVYEKARQRKTLTRLIDEFQDISGF